MPVSQLFLRERVLHHERAVLLGDIGEIGAERLRKIAELSIRSGPQSAARLSLLRQRPGDEHPLPRLYIVDAIAEHYLEQGAGLEEAAACSPYGIMPPRDAMFEPTPIGSTGPFEYLFEGAFDNGVMYTPVINTLTSIDTVGRVAVRDVSYFGTTVYANWVHARREGSAA